MKRDELLQRAFASGNLDVAIRNLAEELCTAGAVRRKRDELLAAIKGAYALNVKLGLVFLALSVLVICLSLKALTFTPAEPWLEFACLLGFCGWCSLIAWRANLSGKADRLTAELAQLEPITTSNSCLAAMAYVETGTPDVIAWRDLAIAERECLLELDVHIMHALWLCTAAAPLIAAGLPMPRVEATTP